jgi:uncharacterized membrane protein YtjA (UPF0391 family)
MSHHTAMFFLVLAALVGALGVTAFAGPGSNIGKDLFLIFVTLFVALVAVSFVLRPRRSESHLGGRVG